MLQCEVPQLPFVSLYGRPVCLKAIKESRLDSSKFLPGLKDAFAVGAIFR